MLKAPTLKEVKAFINGDAKAALEQVRDELAKRGWNANLEEDEAAGTIALVAPSEGVRNFVYGLQSSEQRLAAFTAFEASRPEVRHEARTYFSDGSKGYDVMGMTREQLIADVLVQFERYLALVQMPASQLVSAAPEHSVETS